ncbi:MAG: ATP synthase F1 subunit delta [Bdellovibrionales bacterium]|nr:ATP synthase F1 subunit delta [Bdellovibrionales bacterium]
MTVSEVSTRYARALFEIAVDHKKVSQVLDQIRVVSNLCNGDRDIELFFKSAIIKSDEKRKILEKALKEKGFYEHVESFVFLLAKKGRMALLPEIVESFQELTDQANEVTRGVVHSASVLMQEDRSAIENVVASYLGRKVILTYKEDPKLLGGLVARIGSFIFDDTLATHLKRLKEELKRRAH